MYGNFCGCKNSIFRDRRENNIVCFVLNKNSLSGPLSFMPFRLAS